MKKSKEYHNDRSLYLCPVITMKFSSYLWMLLLITVFNSCKEGYRESTLPQLRIANDSAIPFEEVTIYFHPDARHPYGPLGPGEISDYKEFNFIYRYSFIEIKTPDNTYQLQPVDYVGETRYYTGHFTYHLVITDTGPEFSIDLTFEQND